MEGMHISNKDQQDYSCLIGPWLIKLTNRFKRFVLFSFVWHYQQYFPSDEMPEKNNSYFPRFLVNFASSFSFVTPN